MNKPMRILAAAALVLAPVVGTTSCDPPKPWASCGNVTWPTPGMKYGTSNGAWDVKAHYANCAAARSIATQYWYLGPGRPHAFGSWSCTAGMRYRPDGMERYDVWCNGPSRGVITFVWAI
jgi:hypothetical protein